MHLRVIALIDMTLWRISCMLLN